VTEALYLLVVNVGSKSALSRLALGLFLPASSTMALNCRSIPDPVPYWIACFPTAALVGMGVGGSVVALMVWMLMVMRMAWVLCCWACEPGIGRRKHAPTTRAPHGGGGGGVGNGGGGGGSGSGVSALVKTQLTDKYLEVGLASREREKHAAEALASPEERFNIIAWKYLPGFWVAAFADWMTGPYIYAL
jgi:hypothetical protein